MALHGSVARARLLAGGISLAFLGATLSVLARTPGASHTDDYPLSTFPMFAVLRENTITMSYAVGETPAGRVFLSPELVGTSEVLQARAMIEKAVARGRREADALCGRIALRVGQDSDMRDVTAISIVTGTHDAVAFLVHDVHGTERTITSCPVAR